MKIKVTIWFIVCAVVMLLFPALAAHFAAPEAGMLVSIVLLLIVNPIGSIGTGIFAGQRLRLLWPLPIVLGALFATGYGVFLGLDSSSLFFYALIYIAMGFSAMAVSVMVKKRKQS